VVDQKIDIADAERNAHDAWEEFMTMTSADQRKEALGAALAAFEDALSDQGCWVPDALARVATLERAIEEYNDRLETELANVPNGPVHS
jgi:hypothetical protein